MFDDSTTRRAPSRRTVGSFFRVNPPPRRRMREVEVIPAGSSVTLEGSLWKIESFSSRFLEAERDIIIYTPAGYESDPGRRYPVFYLQDGQNLFDPATAFGGRHWRVGETVDALTREGAIDPPIIVGIANAGEKRVDEYTPSLDANRGFGGAADRYGRFVVEELRPVIDLEFRTLIEPRHTAIGGSSLGGLVSLYLAMAYPERFHKVAALSPSIWWGDRQIVTLFRLVGKRAPLQIWLDIGLAEEEGAVRDARLFRDALEAEGWWLDHDLHYVEAEGAGHGEDAWAARFGDVLRVLFPAISPGVEDDPEDC